MPDDLRTRLDQIAADNGRSLNAEIVHRLEASFADKPGMFVTSDRLSEIISKVTEDAFAKSLQVTAELLESDAGFAKVLAKLSKENPAEDLRRQVALADGKGKKQGTK